MKKIITLLTFLYFILIINEDTYAQLKVYSTNNIGINATEPLSLFAVDGNGFSDSRTTFHNNLTANNQKAVRIYQAMPVGTWIYGLCSSVAYGSTPGISIGVFGSAYRGSSPTGQGQAVGVRGQAGNAGSGYNFPIWAELIGSANGAALFATTPGRGGTPVPGMYAGYFRGNVFIEDGLTVSTVYYPSDINLKKEIVNIESNNIGKIMQLQAIKYKLKNPIELNAFPKEVTDTAKVLMTDLELKSPKYTKDYIGISAQEIQKVYPEIVKVDDNGYLSVDYIELIPVLIEAIKEQQVTIEDLKKQMDALAKKKQ